MKFVFSQCDFLVNFFFFCVLVVLAMAYFREQRVVVKFYFLLKKTGNIRKSINRRFFKRNSRIKVFKEYKY